MTNCVSKDCFSKKLFSFKKKKWKQNQLILNIYKICFRVFFFATLKKEKKERKRKKKKKEERKRMTKKFACILLGGGYGTRLQRDLENVKEYRHLLGFPKPLLPVKEKKSVLDLWLDSIQQTPSRTDGRIEIDVVLVVTNGYYESQFEEWMKRRDLDPSSSLISDSTTSNATRLGAIADIQLVIDKKKEEIGDRPVIIVAGDTLFHESFSLSSYLDSGWSPSAEGVLVYHLPENDDVSKRGIIEIESAKEEEKEEEKRGEGERGSLVTDFLEKPHFSQTKSRLACPAFYVIRNKSLPLIQSFLETHAHLPLAERDAPGKLICWLVKEKKTEIRAYQVEGRYDIGSLNDYFLALKSFNLIEERAFARVGLLGNPSDGFHGKTIAATISNFEATVRIWPNKKLLLVPHPVFDAFEFDGLADLSSHIQRRGYYGGLRLIKATCARFFHLLNSKKEEEKLQQQNQCSTSYSPSGSPNNFAIEYTSTIPYSMGLAGSSAIVTATLKALFRYFDVTIEMLGMKNEEVPSLILSIEQDELGIKAGLQDRVAQWYGGLTFMDFNSQIMISQKHGVYQPMDPSLLPPLYLVYHISRGGGESGKIHSNVRERWEKGDSEVVEGMKKFGELTLKGKKAIEEKDGEVLENLMKENFQLRRKLYSDAVVGENNLEMVENCKEKGFVAKFCGSGGAVVCVVEGKRGSLEREEENDLRLEFSRLGYEFVRISVARPSLSLSKMGLKE